MSYKRPYGNQIVVRSFEDFGTIDSSIEYFIDGIVDIGDNEIVIPSGGMTIRGYNFDQSQLISSEDSYTMFTSVACGNVLATDVAFETSGVGSSLFSLVSNTGFEAIEFNRVNFNNCSSMGYLDNFRQGLESGTGRFGGSPQLELRNAWIGGFRITTSIARGMDDFTALFHAGTGFVFSGRFITDINVDLPTNGALIDFSESNVTNSEALILSGAFVTRDGVLDSDDTTIYPNIDNTSVKSLWRNNSGLPITTKYIKGSVTTEVTTTISADTTYYPLEGTITIDNKSHFEQIANGEFKLLSGNGTYQVSGNYVIEGGRNDELSVRVMVSLDDGSTWTEEVGSITRVVNNLSGPRDVGFFPINMITTLKEGDRVRLEVANLDDTTNVTAELSSYLIVSAI